MVGHGYLSFSPSGSLSVSGQTSYTADLTVPLGGLFKARELFGSDLGALLEDLSEALAA